MKPRKLSRREFTRAIKNGLGSAVLHIKEYGDKEVQDILLQACTKNYIYDHQLDQNRSSWLYQMFIITGNAATYAEHIRNILTNLADIETSKDLDQQMELASYLFEYGYYEFKPLILTLIDYPHTTVSADTLAEALTDMYGFPGFIKGAQLLQKTMNNPDQDEFFSHALFKHACKVLDDESDTKIKELLTETAKTDELIAQYWQGVQNFIDKFENSQPSHESSRPKVTMEEVLALIYNEKAGDKLNNCLRRFSRIASTSDQELLMTIIEKETCEKKLAALLQTFWDAPMPYLPEKVMPLVFSRHKNLRLSARNALENLKHPQVRILALQAIESKKQSNIVTGFYLLGKNYQNEDIAIIKSVLPSLNDRHETHWAASALIDIAAEHNQPELREILLWCFNHNPCGNCRQKTLELLIKRGQAPEQFLFEAQWDVDDRVHRLAREAIQPKLC